MRRTRATIAMTAVTAASLALIGCSAGSGDGDSDTIRVVYQKTEGFVALDDLFQKVKPEFEEANPGITVELEPIVADEGDYATKLALMQQSPRHRARRVLRRHVPRAQRRRRRLPANLDDHLAEWDDWAQFNEGAKEAGRADDGSVYACRSAPTPAASGTSKSVLKAAGVALPWEPKTWDEILDTARQVKAATPDKVAFNVYSGKPAGEGSVMQGFGMLMYGTDDVLYEADEQKWVTGSQGFIDSLEFIETLYGEGLAPRPTWRSTARCGRSSSASGSPAARSLAPSRVRGRRRSGARAASTPGPSTSTTSAWQPSRPRTVRETAQSASRAAGPSRSARTPATRRVVRLPRDGPQPGERAGVQHRELADRRALRRRRDPAYLEANPFIGFFTDLVTYTHFRPATADYPQISAEIQAATEAVMTGQMTPEEAAAAYDEAVVGIVGEET